MDFPQELFDCILENVIDHPTLANCALVNNTWRRHAQKLLFRDLSVLTLLKGHLQAVLQLSPHIRLAIKELSIYELAVFWQPSLDRELGLLISSVANLTHIYLQFEVTGFISRRDLPDFLTATQKLQSVTFSDDDGCLTRNVVDMFRACEGSTVRKIEIRDCEGVFSVEHPSAVGNTLSLPQRYRDWVLWRVV